MIDLEAYLFDRIFSYVAPLVPEGCFKSMAVPRPPAFPFATLFETDNFTDRKHRSSAREEDYAIVTYEANVYAMTKAECRKVMRALDTGMTRLGFMRLSLQFVPNLSDPVLFRYTGRYQAVVDPHKVIYRRS